MEEGAGLHCVYQGEYTVYQRDALYCFMKGSWKQTEFTLKDGFLQGGQFLFCPVEIADKEETVFFIRNGIAYLKRWNRQLLFLWIENPGDHFYNWKLSFFERTVRTQKLFFDGYYLCIAAWERLEVQGDDFVFSYSQTGGYGFGAGDMILPGNTLELRLKTTGERCGTFCGRLSVEKEQAYCVMEKLDAGIRHFRVTDTEKETAAGVRLSEAVNRVLLPKGNLTVDILLTPQNLFDTGRTRFGLSQNIFATHFAANTGKSVNVEAGEDAAFVFQECPIFVYRDEQKGLCARKRLYLGLAGRFYIAENNIHMLCGMSGTETILVKSGGNIRFQPSMPSVAPYDRTAPGTTSWVGCSAGAAYYCQPQESALYSTCSDQGLRFLEVPAASFAEELPAVPMMPFRGLSVEEEEDLLLLEENLYLKRRETLLAAGGDNHSLNLTKAARASTPQGVMTEVTPEGTYRWIGFASLSEDEDVPQMRFTQVDEGLKHKFMQKELLYVVESAQEFEKVRPSEGFCFAIDGVRFSLLPDAWRSGANSRTMLIFQYSAAKCMKEALAENTTFQSVIRNAYTEKGEVRDGYEMLVDAVSDSGFQGLLALNVSASLDEMPPEVKFLMSGIEKERFYATYLIVKAGRIYENSSHELRLAGSKVSGLIDYRAGEQLTYKKDPPDYDYLVREVRIQIEESRLISFMSSSELLINRLFEAKAVSDDNSDGNCLALQGRLVEKDGKKVCQFQLKQSVGYRLSGSAIANVWVQKVDLAADETGSGKFLLSGVLSCHEMEGADLFGFGGANAQEGLPFSQLVLMMEQPEVGNTSLAFTMKYDLLYFDREKIVLREHSFPKRFAVYLEAFLAERVGEAPEKKGYTSITAPVAQGAPPQAYQGFVWRVDVGSLGELSGQNGISLHLMTAFWSGEKENAQYFVGIKLPAALSGEQLKLQGIFKMGFGSVSLEKEDDAYRIRLHNFHLEILGASFPKGNSDIILFSDGKHTGWYASYEEGKNGL